MGKQILLLAAALCVSSVASQAASLDAKMLSKRFNLTASKPVSKDKTLLRRAAASDDKAIIKPYKERMDLWMGDEWVTVSEATIDYDLQGRIIQYDARDLEDEEENIINRTATEYDADGRIIAITESTSEDGGLTWRNDQKKDYAYDDVVTSFRTLVSTSSWTASGWVISMANRYPIVRNDAGSITQVERQVYYMDDYDPTARVTNQVDKENPALVVATRVDEISSYNLQWEENFDLRDIEWHSTDGQVMNFDLTDFLGGTNRITKGMLYYENEPNAEVTGEYPSDFEATVKFELPDGYMILSRMYTDETTGSYYDSKVLVYEEDGETFTEEDLITYLIDDHGNVVEVNQVSMEQGEVIWYASERYVYLYNEDGAPLEIVTAIYDEDEKIYINDFRQIYSAFKHVAGISAPEAASAPAWSIQGNILKVKSASPADVRVVGLDGKTVASALPATDVTIDLAPLTPGLYIVQTVSPDGASTFKIAVR